MAFLQQQQQQQQQKIIKHYNISAYLFRDHTLMILSCHEKSVFYHWAYLYATSVDVINTVYMK